MKSVKVKQWTRLCLKLKVSLDFSNNIIIFLIGEFYKGERIYMVHHSTFYHLLRNNLSLMADFVKRMTMVLELFYQAGVVHADLKPDNILVEFDEPT
jgi:serine/threonine protein kinase